MAASSGKAVTACAANRSPAHGPISEAARRARPQKMPGTCCLRVRWMIGVSPCVGGSGRGRRSRAAAALPSAGRPPCRAAAGCCQNISLSVKRWLGASIAASASTCARISAGRGGAGGAAPAPPGRGSSRPGRRCRSAACGHQRRLGLLRCELLLRARARRARGGRSVKSGGIDSGARVVTVNSSGASRVRPKVRDRPHRCRSRPAPGRRDQQRRRTQVRNVRNWTMQLLRA